ncbi:MULTISPECIES: hypothetical protein [unclassified Mycoplasma]|uniref:hypothetical protein n=1 Tax=unclassified Mycoplasma TaxID=2683645 RepID=UPI00211C3B71|nr:MULTISPECIES: hypothetical protein [unclassified Mycoplasma]UUM19869.1 hypothetical protein NPA11_00300 [Mycoplasma sp. 1578d]UUM24853.1 hypothetical protein NPA12_00300 [Mycoplasma sp. 3686d]
MKRKAKRLISTFSITAPLLTLITTSCSISIFPSKSYLESMRYKTPYFIDLIRMEQQDQGIKTNNSIIFDQFVESLYEKALSWDRKDQEKRTENYRKYIRYDFLKDNKQLIKSVEDFSSHIINKINSLYEDLKLPKTLSDEQIKKIFESDFLNGQSIENILKNSNILILQSNDDRSPIGLSYSLKEQKQNHINILRINPWIIKQTGGYLQSTDLRSEKPVFSVILLSKNQDFKIKYTTKSENNQLLSDLYYKYGYKADQFYDWYFGPDISQAINKIQNEQGILYKENLLLNNLTDESLSDLPLNSKVYTIKTTNDFNEFITSTIQQVAQKLKTSLTKEQVIDNFEKNYLNGQKLENVLKGSDILVQRAIEKPSMLSLNDPDQLVKLASSNSSKIQLAFINEREFNFNLTGKSQSPDKKSMVFYQVLTVPKGAQVEIKDKLNFKETNDFLLLHKNLYSNKEVG